MRRLSGRERILFSLAILAVLVACVGRLDMVLDKRLTRLDELRAENRIRAAQIERMRRTPLQETGKLPDILDELADSERGLSAFSVARVDGASHVTYGGSASGVWNMLVALREAGGAELVAFNLRRIGARVEGYLELVEPANAQ